MKNIIISSLSFFFPASRPEPLQFIHFNPSRLHLHLCCNIVTSVTSGIWALSRSGFTNVTAAKSTVTKCSHIFNEPSPQARLQMLQRCNKWYLCLLKKGLHLSRYANFNLSRLHPHLYCNIAILQQSTQTAPQACSQLLQFIAVLQQLQQTATWSNRARSLSSLLSKRQKI